MLIFGVDVQSALLWGSSNKQNTQIRRDFSTKPPYPTFLWIQACSQGSTTGCPLQHPLLKYLPLLYIIRDLSTIQRSPLSRETHTNRTNIICISTRLILIIEGKHRSSLKQKKIYKLEKKKRGETKDLKGQYLLTDIHRFKCCYVLLF